MNGINQIGIAPGAKWIACKGCISGSCFSSHLTSCAQWIVSPDGAAPPHVVNNSWGGAGGQSWYQSYVQSWVAAGIFPAFANGNAGPSCNTSNSPGDYIESVSAGATDINDVIASFSSRGPSAFGATKPDLSAPGVNVRSSYPTNTYTSISGTSMAAPHLAGAVALLWAGSTFDGNISGTEQVLKALSDSDSITINVVDPNQLASPTNLTAAVNGPVVTLNWTDNSSSETKFEVERKKNGGSWGWIADVGANVTTYQNSPGKGNWQYRVRAFNGNANLYSAYSNIVSARVR